MTKYLRCSGSEAGGEDAQGEFAVLQYKEEGQIIKRHPEYGMEERILLSAIRYDRGTVTIDGKEYPMRDMNFPTVDPADPLRLTDEEEELLHTLELSFRHNTRLHEHVRFLYSNGACINAAIPTCSITAVSR